MHDPLMPGLMPPAAIEHDATIHHHLLKPGSTSRDCISFPSRNNRAKVFNNQPWLTRPHWQPGNNAPPGCGSGARDVC
jgi:hypothetical protein